MALFFTGSTGLVINIAYLFPASTAVLLFTHRFIINSVVQVGLLETPSCLSKLKTRPALTTKK